MGEDILQEWLDKGEEELRSAEYLSTMRHPTPDETICYLCQQSAEKYLKGYLVLKDMEPPKTHDLVELINLGIRPVEDFSVVLQKAKILTDYAVLPRYPNALDITGDAMRMALRYAKDIQEFVIKLVEAENISDMPGESETID